MPPEGLGFGSSSSELTEEAVGSSYPPSSSFFSTTTGRHPAYMLSNAPSNAPDADLDLKDSLSDDDGADSGSGDYRKVRRTANVPRIDKMLILDAAGEFVSAKTAMIRKSNSVRSSKSETSFKVEDSVMDRRKKNSYISITNQEKRDVFKLPSVRRSMRHLNYASVLMTDEALELANKYMEMGPTRASLLQIGYSSVKTANTERLYIEEVNFISPYLRWLGIFRGYSAFTWILCLVYSLCDAAFFGRHIHAVGGIDSVTGPILLLIFVASVVNQTHCFSTAFMGASDPLTAETPIESIHLAGAGYLQLKGLDTLAKAQQRLAKEKGKTVAPEADFALFKKNLVNSCVVEMFAVHLMLPLCVFLWSGISTIVNSIDRGDNLGAALSAGCMMNRLVFAAGSAHVCFSVRLVQKLAEFEIRRVEADIRVVTPNLIHRITPRFKR